MQSHLDMVHQKNSDTVFDFDTQGIEYVLSMEIGSRQKGQPLEQIMDWVSLLLWPY